MKMPEGWETAMLKTINGMYVRSLPDSDFDLDYFNAMIHLKKLANALEQVIPYVEPPMGVESTEEEFDAVCKLGKETQETLEQFRQWKEWRKSE